MSGNSTGKEKAGAVTLAFTVAECGEFHCPGEYHEDIGTLGEAVSIYQNIPPGRMNGVPSIGMKLHTEGGPESGDIEFDIVSGRAVNTGIIHYIPEADSNPLVWEAVQGLMGLFPEKAADS